MKLPKVSEQAKSIIKFEAKLLAAVLLLVLIEFWLVNSLITKGAEIVTNAYTQDLR